LARGYRSPTPAHNRRPELSQHFFRDPALVRRVIASLPLRPDLPVIEIGAGAGIITDALTDRGFRVIAIEKDARLYRALRERFIGRTNVEVHHADALAFALPRGDYSFVSNVPFAITAALVRRLLDAPLPPRDAFLVLQREAAEKFCGAPLETLFSLAHKPRFEITMLRAFRRIDFDPPPRVATALMQVRRRDAPLLTRHESESYRRFVVGTFGRAHTIDQALRRRFTKLQVRRLARDLGFAPEARPSELTFGQWLALYRYYERTCMGRDPALVLMRPFVRPFAVSTGRTYNDAHHKLHRSTNHGLGTAAARR
jgi:23S rRNA (adenine-N6)-dimethyltransferase